MVDLDDLEVLHVDRSGMLDLLLDLPDQLQMGERLGRSADLPSTTSVRAIRRQPWRREREYIPQLDRGAVMSHEELAATE